MRSTTIRAEPLSIEVQQQIDACCDKFEQALKAGESPATSDYLAGVAPVGHAELLLELTAIEFAYRRTQVRGYSEGLHLRCPHCQNQVELLADARLEEITCDSCGDTFSLVDENTTAGGLQALQRIAHFELIRCLGTGGFGSVWEARDTELDRLVALKIPRKSQLSAREAEQFFREARTAAQLKHRHIVPVHEVGKEGSIVFIVTDLIHGVPLSESLLESTLSTQETAQLCATLAEALAYAHQQGVIHRDLKPSNVMLDQERQPHLLDFGLAKRETGAITMTLDGTVLGTPAYMSPEQATGKSHWIDRRTDIYSMGVMLFQMLTQELPYRGTAQQQIQQRVDDDAPDPRKLNAHVPDDLATICLKCLERDPNRRFATADEFAAELRRYLRGEPIKSRPISNIHRAARWAKRKPALATAALLTAVLAIAGPLAAVSIESGRLIIKGQHDERGRVIARNEQEKEELASRLEQVEQQLTAIRKAHPGMEEVSFWHQRLIADFIKENQKARENLLKQPPATASRELQQQAEAHLGWEYLLDSAGQQQAAARHGSIARDLLTSLNLRQPGVSRFRILLAECLTELSELQYSLGQQEQAARSANDALSLRNSLAAAHPDDLKYQLDQFYSVGKQLKFDQMITEQGQKTAEAKTWMKLKNDLSQKLTVEPEDFYSLACYLTQHDTHSAHDLAPISASEILEQDEVE